jgi:hypothetical protein
MHDKKKKSQLITEDEIKTNQQKERIKKAFSILQELFNKKSQCDLYKKLLNSKDISPKILLQNEDFFDEPDFNDSSALAISEELLAIYPEFTPIWNYRRFLLLTKFFSIRKNEKVKTFVKLPIYGDIETSLSLLVEELCLIQRLFRHTCKNYGIWYHRWYIVEVLCRLFTTLDHKKTLFQSELDIVESLLVKDDRNFYCWNYRQLLLNLLLETSDSAPSLDKTIFSILSHTGFVCFLKQHVKGIQCIPAQQIVSYYQLYTSSKMINRNISNYSAWHLRMKYFTQSSTQSDQEMQEELSFVETVLLFFDFIYGSIYGYQAFYTDPNNSGVWNYYKFYVFRKASQMTHDYPK